MKNALVLVALLLSSCYAMGQRPAFGLKGGLNRAKVMGEHVPKNAQGISEYYLGLFAQLPIYEVWGVQAELLYVRQGLERQNSNARYHTSLQYLYAPVLLEIYMTKGFSIVSGPQVGLLLNAERVATTLGKSETSQVKNDFKNLDFGWVFGLECEVFAKVVVGIRYNFGMLNIPVNDQDYRNEALQVGVGFAF